MAHAGPVPAVTREHSVSGEKLSLLAVFAHPEDESFGPAGTLAKYANEGVQVSLAMATRESAPSLSAVKAYADDATAQARDRMCSCRTSGVRRVCVLDSRPGELAKLTDVLKQDHINNQAMSIQDANEYLLALYDVRSQTGRRVAPRRPCRGAGGDSREAGPSSHARSPRSPLHRECVISG